MGTRLKRQREAIALFTFKKKAKEEGEEGAGRDRTDSYVLVFI